MSAMYHGELRKYLLLWLLLLMPVQALADSRMQSLLEMNIEDLMDIEVVSAMRRPQSVADTASAIYVITQQDIRRSGATALPEMLRLAPGVEVARYNGQKWAVSIRGFNGEFADKLLVMIDGRTVYTPLHGGVYWDVQDFIADDIERIEIIRGPGGSLWGANAINGIINVVSKSSDETKGGLIVAGTGDEERRFASLRQGGEINDAADYRVYVKGFQRENGVKFYTDPQIDGWSQWQTGFRTDWQLSASDELTVQGDVYRGREGLETSLTSLTAPYNTTIADTVKVSGGNLVANWSRELAESSQFDLKFYFDRTNRDKTSFTELRNTYDLDMQHRFQLADNQELIWGVAYRLSKDETTDSFFSTIMPASATLQTKSAVLQDEITFLQEKLLFTLGTKLENNPYMGSKWLPSMRMLWRGDGHYSLWASASRAVRSPSRSERDLTHNVYVLAPPMMPTVVPISVSGSRDFGPMYVNAYEMGARGQLSSQFYLDAAVFHNIYRQLSVYDEQAFNYQLTNNMDGSSYGGELLLRWSPTDSWRLSSSYALLKLKLEPYNVTVSDFTSSGESPKHQFKLQSSWDLMRGVELDGYFYRVSAAGVQYDGYNRFDLRVGWKASSDLTLSLAGQNLFNPKHIEAHAYEVSRSAYVKLVWVY